MDARALKSVGVKLKGGEAAGRQVGKLGALGSPEDTHDPSVTISRVK